MSDASKIIRYYVSDSDSPEANPPILNVDSTKDEFIASFSQQRVESVVPERCDLYRRDDDLFVLITFRRADNIMKALKGLPAPIHKGEHLTHSEAANRLREVDLLTEAKRLDEQKSANSANKTALFPKGIPDDVDLIDLVVQINSESAKPKEERRSMRQIAKEHFKEIDVAWDKTKKAKRYYNLIRTRRKRGKINLNWD